MEVEDEGREVVLLLAVYPAKREFRGSGVERERGEGAKRLDGWDG